ncbi:uncharacterized protein FSUBG_138 [Fusarium subglutinans]|uniref:Uncharacterized protein n=1 Tax=Gibberella subglutinans TaxID=42677 RepID=A0A8H5QHH8_GIBSU|nr:uncharacterized protein FSUBG_138 [Fusarium subglutinans]KAF5614258.1 hypothetical protein FSUBG_138 [Fusarium subglutinans]
MFECNDYLHFDLEHPRQAACLQVSVEDDLANNGTAFKFTCVEFRGSAAAKKYVANVKLKSLELSTTTEDSLTSKSWCLGIPQYKMMQKGGDDIAGNMKKGGEHFGAMGRTDPKQKQNDNTRQWNRQDPRPPKCSKQTTFLVSILNITNRL